MDPHRNGVRAVLARLDGEPADAIESETFECKGWDPGASARAAQVRDLRETVVCLANRRGGTIVLGVADRKRTRREAIQGVGVLDPAELRRAIYDGTEPHVLVEIEELVEPEGRLLVVRVPRGLPPHTTSEGLAKIRVGKECKPLTGTDLSRLVLAGGARDLSAEVVPAASPRDLDPEAVELLRRTLASEGSKPDLARFDAADLLAHLGLAREDEVTLAGLLLLGRAGALARRVPQHELVFLRLKGATRYDVRHDSRGPILLVLEELRRLFEAHLGLTTVGAGFYELHVPDLTWWAAREAVLNALAHRDYFLHQAVQIEVHAGGVTVTSPGGFIGGVDASNVLRHPPVRRNALLAAALQSVGLVNRAGLGVDRIYEELLRLGKPLPRYEADESHVSLTLPTLTHEDFARFVAAEARAGRAPGLDDLIVLRAAADLGALDRWSAARALQLPEEDAAARLAALRARGLLAPEGRGRGTGYRLAPRLAAAIGGPPWTVADRPLDPDALRRRVLALARQRGRVANADVRALGGCSRIEAARLLGALRDERLLALRGRGRGAHYAPAQRPRAPSAGARGVDGQRARAGARRRAPGARGPGPDPARQRRPGPRGGQRARGARSAGPPGSGDRARGDGRRHARHEQKPRPGRRRDMIRVGRGQLT